MKPPRGGGHGGGIHGRDDMDDRHGLSKDEYGKKWREWCEWFLNGEKPTGKPPGEKDSNWDWKDKDPSWYDSFKNNYLEPDEQKADEDSEKKVIVGAVIGAILALIAIAVIIIIVVCCIKKKKRDAELAAKKVNNSKIQTVSHGTTPWHPKEKEAMGKHHYGHMVFNTPVEHVEKGFGIPEDPRQYMNVYSPPPAYEEGPTMIHVVSANK